jgi:hypothetical protein
MARSDTPWQRCALCEREVPPELITLHHLKPRQKGGTAEDRTPVCRPCHKQIHALFGNADLAKSYASIQALQGSPQLQGFIKWIRKQRPERNFRVVTSNDHPSRRRRRRP